VRCGVAPVAMSSGEGDGPPRNHRLDLMSFVGSPSGSFGLVLCRPAGHVCLGFGVAAGLGDVDRCAIRS
jgi:hypothetical protein